MQKLLDKAFKEASKLDKEEQDAFAAFILAELKREKEWKESFKRSQVQLRSLAKEALREYDDENTAPLDPDEL